MYLVGTNLIQDADFSRPAKRIRILTDVFLGERVNVFVGFFFVDLHDFAPHRKKPVWVVGILNAEGHMGVPPHILVLDAALGGIDAHVSSIKVAPHGGDLRSSILHHRSQLRESFLLEEIPKIVWNWVGHKESSVTFPPSYEF